MKTAEQMLRDLGYHRKDENTFVTGDGSGRIRFLIMNKPYIEVEKYGEPVSGVSVELIYALAQLASEKENEADEMPSYLPM